MAPLREKAIYAEARLGTWHFLTAGDLETIPSSHSCG